MSRFRSTLGAVKRALRQRLGLDFSPRVECEREKARLGSDYGGYWIWPEALNAASVVYSVGVTVIENFHLGRRLLAGKAGFDPSSLADVRRRTRTPVAPLSSEEERAVRELLVRLERALVDRDLEALRDLIASVEGTSEARVDDLLEEIRRRPEPPRILVSDALNRPANWIRFQAGAYSLAAMRDGPVAARSLEVSRSAQGALRVRLRNGRSPASGAASSCSHTKGDRRQ